MALPVECVAGCGESSSRSPALLLRYLPLAWTGTDKQVDKVSFVEEVDAGARLAIEDEFEPVHIRRLLTVPTLAHGVAG